jgi:hypothetical protein
MQTLTYSNKSEAQNLVACSVRYIGPTNCRGSRIKLNLPRFDESLTISYDYTARDAEAGAVKFLESNGLAPIARACGADHSAILLFSFSDADSLLSLFRR